MNKCITILLLTTFFGIVAKAQSCYPDYLELYSQADIDAFKIEHPSCKVIEGDVYLLYSNATNLNGLSNLTEIRGNLYIEGNSLLANLNGLGNLSTVGGYFYLGDHDGMTNLSGLSKLKSVGKVFQIQDNLALQNLNGAAGLQSVGSLIVQGNQSLTSLSGLENMTASPDSIKIIGNGNLSNINGLNGVSGVLGKLVLQSNPSLTDLSGLSNLITVGGDLEISNCPGLANFAGFSSLVSVDGDVSISQNAQLQNLVGLESLFFINGNLSVQGNPGLAGFDGLNNLQSVGKSLYITGNNGLQNIAALQTLNALYGDLHLQSNPLLQNLDGLTGLTAVGGGILIDDNKALTAIDGLQNMASTAGDVAISGNEQLQNLAGLDNLRSIGGSFLLSNNPALSSLAGLENLETVGAWMSVTTNNTLASLAGLDNLTTVGGYLSILSNPMLTSLGGFGELTHVAWDLTFSDNLQLTNVNSLGKLNYIGGILGIEANAALSNLDSLHNLTYVGSGLSIKFNDNLLTIIGLNQVYLPGGLVEISNNPNLAACSAPPICQRIFSWPLSVNIFSNAPGCNSQADVGENCDNTPVFVSVKIDSDGDCLPDAANLPVPGATVWLTALEQTTLRPTDAAGLVQFRYYNNSQCFVRPARFPDANWDVCGADTLEFIPGVSPDTVAFLLKPKNQCPELTLKLGLPSAFSDCSLASTVVVSAKNTGAATAQGLKIAVVMPPEFDLLAAEPTPAAQTNDTLFFDMNALAPLASAVVRLMVKTKCAGVLPERTLCWAAFGSLTNGCPVNSPPFSEVKISGECVGGQVLFTLKNIGNAATQGLHEYAVIRNQILQTTHPFALNAGETLQIEMPSDGATYRIEATKLADGARTALSLEGCGGLTPGFILPFWLDNGPLATDFDCRQLLDSKQFTGKNVIPAGVGPDRMIPPNLPVQYTIDFQNIGTQVVTQVSLRDELPPELDAGSIRPGAASHPFRWQIRHGNILQVAFEPPEFSGLADTMSNAAASHGFFTFEIDPMPGLPNGTVVANTAAAFFDNALSPVFRDTARFSISQTGAQGLGCLTEGIVLTTQEQVDDFPILYPGCSRIEGDLRIEGSDIHDLTPLSTLQVIGGGLSLGFCPNLKTLNGLQNLAVIGKNLEIGSMDSLVSLTGLGKLYKIGGDINIFQNPELTSTDGMDSLLSLGMGVRLAANPKLADLNVLKNFDTILGSLLLQDNYSLPNTDGLRNLTKIRGELRIYGCPGLPDLHGLDSLMSIGGNLSLNYAGVAGDLTGLGNLRSIGGDFYAGSSSPGLQNFKGLTRLDSVGGTLIVEWNPNLKSFEGLNRLRHAGGVFIAANDSLPNFVGLDSLADVLGDFRLYYNYGMTDFTGLENLRSIGGGLEIFAMDALTSLNGLGNLRQIGDSLTVWQNALLPDLSGLSTLDSVGGSFRVTNNPLLASLVGPENLTFIGLHFVAADNPLLTQWTGLEKLEHVGGDVFVPTTLTGFAGVSSLKTVGGNLEIRDNVLLPDLNGLENLATVGGNLIVTQTPNLTNMDALQKLQSVGGHFDFTGFAPNLNLHFLDSLVSVGGDFRINYALQTFEGAEKLRFIGGDLIVYGHEPFPNFNGLNMLDSIGGSFMCQYNYSLQSMSGLENLRVVGGNFVIESAYLLQNLDGLKNLRSIGGYLSLFGNQALTDCAIYVVCERLTVSDPGGQNTYINVNAPGCGDNNNAAAACHAVGIPVRARVLLDVNGDCQPDVADVPLPDFSVFLSDGSGVQQWLKPTDAAGLANFNFQGFGSFLVSSAGFRSGFWEICQDSFLLSPGTDLSDTLETTFLVKPKQQTLCPELTTTLVLPTNFRGCLATSELRVLVQNTGTVLAEFGQTALVVPPVFEVLTTEPPASAQSGDTLFFDLADLDRFERTTMKLVLKTKCDTFLFGQTLCMEAFSSAENDCPALPSGVSEIQLSAECLADTALRFSLKNIGDAPTQAPHEYRILRNAEIFKTGNFALAAGESTHVELKADSATYRMEATKRDDGARTAVALENCGGLTTGQITSFWLETGPAARDFVCAQVLGAFDPNRKTAVPVGATDWNFIEANQPIRYTIDFQNTGTDTAFRVLLRDALHGNLNLRTFRPVAASHPDYVWEIRPGGILEVLFSPIMLPDSNVNEAASHGFFSFDIDQMPDLPEGAYFYNSAEIQFDFNPFITTNWVQHYIGQLSVFVGTSEAAGNAPGWLVFGNPTRDAAVFRAAEFVPGEKHLDLFDAAGRPVRSARFSGQTFEFRRDGLPAGYYFFHIGDANGRRSAGTIIVLD